MGQSAVDSYSVRVPAGEGYIIGDTLRKYATRSIGSWQVAGYKVDTQSPNFGFSNGIMVSYLDLLKGSLLCSDNQVAGDPKLCRFTWNGECFACDSFELHGLTRSVGDSITALLVYARGYHSAEQNYEIIRSTAGVDPDGFFAVPSAHSVVHCFKYRIQEIDNSAEWLIIEADQGVVHTALQNVVKSLDELNI